MYVVILETFSYVQTFYTQINNNQMERELFNNMFEEFIKCFRPFKRAAMMHRAARKRRATRCSEM